MAVWSGTIGDDSSADFDQHLTMAGSVLYLPLFYRRYPRHHSIGDSIVITGLYNGDSCQLCAVDYRKTGVITRDTSRALPTLGNDLFPLVAGGPNQQHFTCISLIGFHLAESLPQGTGRKDWP